MAVVQRSLELRCQFKHVFELTVGNILLKQSANIDNVLAQQTVLPREDGKPALHVGRPTCFIMTEILCHTLLLVILYFAEFGKKLNDFG